MMLPWVSTASGLSFSDALFTTVSALSVTGLTVITPSLELTVLGQICLVCLIQLGGVGYMVLAILIFRLLGRAVSLADRLALKDALGLLNISGIVELAKKVFIAVLTVEAVGAVLLFFHWSRVGPLADESPGKVAFYAGFHAISAFCNAGFNLFNGTYDFPDDSISLLIIGGLVALGGLGIPVIFDFIARRKAKHFSLHTKLTLIVTACLFLFGMLGILISESRPGHLLDQLPVARQLELSAFHSVSCRSGGFIAVPEFQYLAPASQLITFTLMFIGCGPASMGGGITTGTFLVMLLALFAYIRRQSTPIVYGRAIPGEMVRKAAAVLTVSLFAVLTGSGLILLTHETTLDAALFEVVSAFATCGLSLGFTENLNEFGRLVVVCMMFWGRLGALTVLFAFTRPGVLRRVTYPEEKILIG